MWPEDGKINVANIPAMMRRRMSSISKLAVQTAIELLNKHKVDYLVFSSRHGELHRSVSLIEDLIYGEEASPMAFSQSVHNTAAGLTTIATKQPISLASISAAENTFQSAILEAWLFLADNPDKKVLLVDFDEPIPDAYLEYENQKYQGFGLGLILSYGDNFTVQSTICTECAPSHLPQGLAFLRHYLSDENQWTIYAPHQAWKWRQNDSL